MLPFFFYSTQKKVWFHSSQYFGLANLVFVWKKTLRVIRSFFPPSSSIVKEYGSFDLLVKCAGNALDILF